MIGNPFYEALKDDAKYYALKKVPNLKSIDGIIVQATFMKKSAELSDVFPPALKWSLLHDRIYYFDKRWLHVGVFDGLFDGYLGRNGSGFGMIKDRILISCKDLVSWL